MARALLEITLRHSLQAKDSVSKRKTDIRYAWYKFNWISVTHEKLSWANKIECRCRAAVNLILLAWLANKV